MKSLRIARRRGQHALIPRFEPFENRLLLAVFSVTSSADEGTNTLRTAILGVNASQDPSNQIKFAIPTNDPGYNPATNIWTIAPGSALPPITQPVSIDAAAGLSGTFKPLIQLNGAFAGTSSDGLVLSGSSSNSLIRGLAIYEFSGAGIHIISGSDKIQSNYLGLDSAETPGITGNHTGLLIDGGSGSTVGGLSGSGNLISNNILDGILISGDSTTKNILIGNDIGTDSAGLDNRGNGRNGILITRTTPGASNDTIGGSSKSLGNTIAFNKGAAVSIDDATGNAVRQNSIFRNSEGITLKNKANAGSTAPILTSVATSPGSTVVGGTISGASSNTDFTLDFYASGSGDPFGLVQARTYLGSGTVKTDSSGNGVFSTTLSTRVSVGLSITATATSTTSNSTSPFSKGTGLDKSSFQVTNTNDSGTGSLRQAILNANVVVGSSTIVFALPSTASLNVNYNPAIGWTFNPASPLPVISTKTTIDGTSQQSFAGTPRLVVDGSNAGKGVSGFVIGANASGTVIKGVLVENFNGDGVRIQSSNNTVLFDSITANTGAGVDITAGSGNTISQSTIFGNLANGITQGAGTNGSQAAPSNLRFLSLPGQTRIEGSIAGQTTGSYTVEFFVGAAGVSGSDIEAATFLGSQQVQVVAGNLAPNPTAFSAILNISPVITSSERIFATVTSPSTAPLGRANNTSPFAESAAISSPYVVTTNADSGIGSLRQAILNADSQGPGATISFDISGSVVIQPLSSLPPVTVPLTIDGNSQPGVVINGNQLFGAGLTLAVGSDGSVIRGLTFESFSGAGINILSNNNRLTGDQFNSSSYGVFISGGSGNVVDGGIPVNSSSYSFSNNTGAAIFVQSGSGNQFIDNNYLNNRVPGNPAIQYAANQTSPIAPVILSLTSVGGNSQVNFSLGGPLNQPVRIDFYTVSSNGLLLQLLQSGTVTPTSSSQLFSTTLSGSVNSVVAIATSTGTGNSYGTSVFSNSATITTNFIVTNNNDSGTGSLRQVLLDSENIPDAQILFNIAREISGPTNELTIQLETPLTVDHPVTINGFSEYDFLSGMGQIDGARRQLIVLDGSLIENSQSASTAEMVVTTTGTSKSIIEGLCFVSTASATSGSLDSAIQITGTSAQITSDLIGVNYDQATYSQSFPAGSPAFKYGIHVMDPIGGNMIGGISPPGVSPTIIGETITAGIFLDSSRNTTIQNVYVGIGINPTVPGKSQAPLGNRGFGIEILGGSGNQVGGSSSQSLVVVSGNEGYGIVMSAGTSSNLVENTFIGTDSTGSLAVPNMMGGVRLSGVSGNTIGGSYTNTTDIISGNVGDGILIDGGSASNTVENAFIGTDVTGLKAIANTDNGVHVTNSQTSNNDIGGTSHTTVLVISGNSQNGVLLDGGSTSTTVRDAYIGLDSTGETELSNQGDGVRIDESASNQIGGSNPMVAGTTSFSNLISGNVRYGISINGSGSNSNFVLGNAIGSDLLTSNHTGNHGGGLEIYDAGNNQIGGAGMLRNQISANSNDGVDIHYDVDAKRDATGNNQVLGNVISGNAQNGIRVMSSGTSFSNDAVDTIQGNEIGSNDDGSASFVSGVMLGNGADGIYVKGARVVIDQNIISGNHGNGIHAVGSGSAPANTVNVYGNRIGTNRAGDKALGNLGNGIFLDGVHGSAALSNNLVSGNHSNGIRLFQSQGIVVQGNYVGTAAKGAVPSQSANLGNVSNGIFLDQSSGNWIGGTFAEGNTVSGNGESGIFVSGTSGASNNGSTMASGNTISGNRIGLDSTGYIALGNKFAGIVLSGSGAINNTIGYTTKVDPSDRLNPIPNYDGNVISANAVLGILVSLRANANLILGNMIGTDKDGNARREFVDAKKQVHLALGNGSDGIFLNGVSNTLIGGAAEEDRNFIEGNGANGVHIFGSASIANSLINNFIGLYTNFSLLSGNQANGVVVDDAGSGNFIGGGNRISGNAQSGILLYSTTGTGGTIISDNVIGLSVDGLTAVGNGGAGVFVFGSSNNTIGTSPQGGGGNFISGNNQAGIEIFSPAMSAPADQNQVLGNKIGLDATGASAIPNRSDGVQIYNGSFNAIGGLGTDERNTISGNLQDGIFIDVFTSRNDVQGRNVINGNFIGTDVTGMSAVGSQINGILINDSPPNRIGYVSSDASEPTPTLPGTNVAANPCNVICGNTQAGIQFSGASSQNVVEGNYIGVRVDGVGGANLKNGFGVYVNNQGSFNSFDEIGGDTPGSGNIIDGGATSPGSNGNNSAYAGIFLSGPQDPAFQGGTHILGNLIGLDANGAVAGSQVGILINNSSGNVIGGFNFNSRNVISGNVDVGVNVINPLSTNNLLVGNFIGTNLDGSNVPSSLVPQSANLGGLQQTGVSFSNAFNNTLGSSGSGNTISGNVVGVLLNGVNAVNPGQGNTISNNKIGTNPGGTSAVPNEETGVYVNGSGGNAISGNLISANGISGVTIFGAQSSGNVVDGNDIGPGVGPTGQLQNSFVFTKFAPAPLPTRVPGYSVYLGAQLNGVSIIGASNNVIGGPSGNTISGNLDVGLYIAKRDFSGNVYLAPTNTQILGDKITQNGIYGLLLYDAPNNASGSGTVVTGNPVNVLNYVSGSSTNGTGSGLTPHSIFLPPVTQTSSSSVPAGPRHRRRR